MARTVQTTRKKRKYAPMYKNSKKLRTSSYYPNVATNTVSTLPRIGTGNFTIVKMNYVEKNITVTGGVAGAASFYSFRINDVYDPNYTGGGHQPMAHDQYAAMYENYLVTGCSYKVYFSNSSSTNRQLVGVYASNKSSTDIDPTIIMENGMGQFSTLGITDAKEVCLSGFISMPKINGITLAALRASSDYRTNFFGSPVDPVFLHVWGSDITSSTGTGINLIVCLTFTVEVRGNILTGQS